MILQRYLTSYSVKVLTESGPDKVVPLVKAEKPLLIFLERTLIPCDGLLVYEKLQKDPKTKNIPVVLLSKDITKQEIQDAIKLGIFSFLKKPFTEEQLIQIISNILPIKKQAASDKEDAIQGTYEILIVDDDPISQKFVANEFSDSRFKMTFANNGKEALEIIKDKKFDFITTDVEMPEMNGFELCAELKSNASTAAIPVIILTGTSLKDARVRGFESGASEFFLKPFKNGALRCKIDDLIANLNYKTDKTIVVAAKNVTLLSMISFMLKKKGLKGNVFSSGKEVLIFQNNHDIDLLIVEEYLDDQSGIELVRLLRARDRDNYLPIIFLSKGDTDSIMDIAYKNGVNHFVHTPFVEEEIMGTINVQLGSKRIFDNLQSRNKVLHDLSITDGLTNLFNKSFTEKFLQEKFLEIQKDNIPISCLFIDADHFKEVNDTHGHDYGDMVLKDISRKLLKHTPKDSIAGRFGGEEFVMILPGRDFEKGCDIAENLREDIENHVFDDGKTQLKKTVSIGVCAYPEVQVDHYSQLLKYADNALYNAKNNGRNQVWRYSPLDEEGNLVDVLKVYRTMFHESLDAMLTVDDDGRIRHYNNAAKNIFLYSPAEVINHRIEKLMPEKYRHDHVTQIDNYIKNNMPKIDKVRIVPALRKDGTEIKIELSISKIGLEKNGEFLAIIREVK